MNTFLFVVSCIVALGVGGFLYLVIFQKKGMQYRLVLVKVVAALKTSTLHIAWLEEGCLQVQTEDTSHSNAFLCTFFTFRGLDYEHKERLYKRVSLLGISYVEQTTTMIVIEDQRGGKLGVKLCLQFCDNKPYALQAMAIGAGFWSDVTVEHFHEVKMREVHKQILLCREHIA